MIVYKVEHENGNFYTDELCDVIGLIEHMQVDDKYSVSVEEVEETWFESLKEFKGF